MDRESEEYWRGLASQVFGYKLGCKHNQDEIARALSQIFDLLNENRDVQISVREHVEDADIIDATPIGRPGSTSAPDPVGPNK